jgi:hypothetical protein
MALSAAANTLNTAVDTLEAAFSTYIDTLSANDEVQIAFVKSKYGDNANNTKWGDADGATQKTRFDTGRKFRFTVNPDAAGDIPLEIAGRPLFFKVTNDAGDLTS